jgi:hypothetical protein
MPTLRNPAMPTLRIKFAQDGAIYAAHSPDEPVPVVLDQPVRFRALGVRKDWGYTDHAGAPQTSPDYPQPPDVADGIMPYRRFDYTLDLEELE